MRPKKVLQRIRKQKERTLYVRLPHVIRDEKDVAQFFTGDFKVRLLRQSSKYCYVIFHDVEEKMKNLKDAKNLKLNGKRVVVASASTKIQKKTEKVPRKKIIIPEVKPEAKVTRILFVSNIKCGTTLLELKASIPGCVSVKMLKPYSTKHRAAMVKLESALLAAEYIAKVREWPRVQGSRLRFNADTRHRKRTEKSQPLKIYDGESEVEAKPSRTERRESLDHIVLENKE